MHRVGAPAAGVAARVPCEIDPKPVCLDGQITPFRVKSQIKKYFALPEF
jgi:hypothetical protein